MTDLSRDELRAHLSSVEAQVRAALRIVAAESKSMQQAHSALRADLSAALVRLQSDLGTSSNRLDSKLDRLSHDVNHMPTHRRLTNVGLAVVVMIVGIALGIVIGGIALSRPDNEARVSLPLGTGAASGTFGQAPPAGGQSTPLRIGQ